MLKQMKLFALVGALASVSAANSAQAAGWIVGLVDGKQIVTIDPATRKVASKADIKGAEKLVGIDVRPADGMLYGIAVDGSVVTIDLKSGQATVKSKLSEKFKPDVTHIMDFNPVVDRVRLMTSEGANLRVSVDEGKWFGDQSHKYKDGDPNAGKRPRVVAGAYTNSWQGTKMTTLYDIDATTNSLVTQVPPNDGVLNTVGPLGITLSGPVAFNIVSQGEDKNDGWLVTGGALYSVDLKSGKATMAGKIEGLNGTLTDIAWVD
jgi:Domain of unknown function (DUF4394)